MSRAVLRWCIAGLLLSHLGLLLGNIWLHSSTGYEQMHLASGIVAWRTGRFQAYSVNPPLVRLVAALPAVLFYSEAELPLVEDTTVFRPEASLGLQLAQRLGCRVNDALIWARLACLPFSLLGAVACWGWGRAMGGDAAGLVALGLWCFSPGLLTYGAVTTTDGPTAACTVLAGWAYYTWLVHGQAHRAWCAGLALGLALLAKFTCLVLLPGFVAIWVLQRWQHRRAALPPGARPSFAQLALLAAVAFLVVNTAYGFEGTLRPLGRYAFTSPRMGAPAVRTHVVATGNRFQGTPLGWLPVPLPSLYVEGLDLQCWDLDQLRPCYLGGRWLPEGVWYYYLYGLAVKAPLGHWVLALCAGMGVLGGWRRQLQASRLLAPALALAILVLVSCEANGCMFLRYVLPAAGPFFVWTASSVCWPGGWFRGRCWGAAACLAASAVSVLWYYPHTLAYFNELAGGPAAGPRHLLGAEVDFGQDRKFLLRWLAANPHARPFYTNMLLLGVADEPWARDVHEMPQGPLPEGWYGVSVNDVYGQPPPYPELRLARKVGRIGYSIYIYQLARPPQQAR